jgi:hypothetical protein
MRRVAVHHWSAYRGRSHRVADFPHFTTCSPYPILHSLIFYLARVGGLVKEPGLARYFRNHLGLRYQQLREKIRVQGRTKL